MAGPEDRPIKFVLHGVSRRIEVAGKTYNQEMPDFEPVLPNADIASLVSYVRSRFAAASAPVPRSTVSLIRATNLAGHYWTVAELLKEP